MKRSECCRLAARQHITVFVVSSNTSWIPIEILTRTCEAIPVPTVQLELQPPHHPPSRKTLILSMSLSKARPTTRTKNKDTHPGDAIPKKARRTKAQMLAAQEAEKAAKKRKEVEKEKKLTNIA